MTEDNRRLLRENNQMLRYLIQHLCKDEVTQNEFISNIIANLISSRIDR